MSSNSLELEIDQHLTHVDYTRDVQSNGTNIFLNQIETTPLFSSQVLTAVADTRLSSPNENAAPVSGLTVLPQYGLLGIRLETYGNQPVVGARKPVENESDGEFEEEPEKDQSVGGKLEEKYGQKTNEIDDNPRDQLVYANTNAPWSAFICGSQGSGKSHTLSCMLENSLMNPSKTGKNITPLTALVLHYDKFTGVETGQLCEAAYLCSAGIPVRVLVSPSNHSRMKNLYQNLPGLPSDSKRPEVVPLKLSNKHLSVGRMKSLMAIGGKDGTPLYMEVVSKILRGMAEEEEPFDFIKFKMLLGSQDWIRGQAAPLEMRLQLLESFLDIDKSRLPDLFQQNGKTSGYKPRKNASPYALLSQQKAGNTAWEFEPGTLTIIDLSCPFVDENEACALFNICVGIFLEGRNNGGRIVALDEAHKFLDNESREVKCLTDTMLDLIRQQRHLATRVIIATQEPTLSPKLLDLCNITIVHRFSSPAWFKTLRGHLAGVLLDSSDSSNSVKKADSLFAKIVCLKTGEALVFCPSAVLDMIGKNGSTMERPLTCELGRQCIKMKVRSRVTADGGKSILAHESLENM